MSQDEIDTVIEAFAAELIDRIEDETVRGHFRNQLTHWLAGEPL